MTWSRSFEMLVENNGVKNEHLIPQNINHGTGYLILSFTSLFIILKCPYPEYLPQSFFWGAYLQNELLLFQSQFPYHDVLALQLIHLDDLDPEYYEDKFLPAKGRNASFAFASCNWYCCYNTKASIDCRKSNFSLVSSLQSGSYSGRNYTNVFCTFHRYPFQCQCRRRGQISFIGICKILEIFSPSTLSIFFF